MLGIAFRGATSVESLVLILTKFLDAVSTTPSQTIYLATYKNSNIFTSSELRSLTCSRDHRFRAAPTSMILGEAVVIQNY